MQEMSQIQRSMWVIWWVKHMKIPSIKEDRLQMLLEILECMDKHRFNRDKVRDCILKLYPGKSEKSVFRGMAINTMRNLGLIFGRDEFIRPGANGKLLLESKCNNDRFNETRATVFLEIDKIFFGFIDALGKYKSKSIFYMEFANKIEGNEEYKEAWLKLLEAVGLIELTKEKKWARRSIFLLNDKVSIAEDNLNYVKKKKFFKEHLFSIYKELSPKQVGIVDIEDLRAGVGLKLLREQGAILTEMQFDHLLRKIPLVTRKYIISFGRPMGAEEKLFELNGKYYRTLSITSFAT